MIQQLADISSKNIGGPSANMLQSQQTFVPPATQKKKEDGTAMKFTKNKEQTYINDF